MEVKQLPPCHQAVPLVPCSAAPVGWERAASLRSPSAHTWDHPSTDGSWHFRSTQPVTASFRTPPYLCDWLCTWQQHFWNTRVCQHISGKGRVMCAMTPYPSALSLQTQHASSKAGHCRWITGSSHLHLRSQACQPPDTQGCDSGARWGPHSLQ